MERSGWRRRPVGWVRVTRCAARVGGGSEGVRKEELKEEKITFTKLVFTKPINIADEIAKQLSGATVNSRGIAAAKDVFTGRNHAEQQGACSRPPRARELPCDGQPVCPSDAAARQGRAVAREEAGHAIRKAGSRAGQGKAPRRTPTHEPLAAKHIIISHPLTLRGPLALASRRWPQHRALGSPSAIQ